MKKIKILLLFFLVTLLISSCEKNFDPQIYGQLFTTNFPKTDADYEAYMMTCYVPFTVNWGYQLTAGWQHNFYVSEGGFMRLFDSTSDLCAPWVIGGWGGAWLELSQANYNNCILYGRGSGGSPSNFEKVRDITRFTEIIGVLQKATVLTEARKAALVGEARFLRGMMMYYLLHIYGPVPVILDPALVGNADAEKNMERPTLDDFTKWITDDLQAGVDNMTAANTSSRGRYTSNYARYCLMRHCLNEGSHMTGYYDKAIALYTDLKTGGFGLYTTGTTSYADQFKIANKFNKEVIMAVSCSKTGDGSGKNGNFNPTSWYVVPSNVSKYADVANTIPTPFVNQGGGWGQCFNISQSFYNTFEAGDKRAATILTSYIQNNSSRTLITAADLGVKWSGFVVNKYPIETTDAFQSTDIPLARWADVLLMYSEAVARKNNAVPTGEALQNVNDVRARAGLPTLSGTAVASYAGFMDALLAERGHELFYEGGRKIDLIRFNKYRHNCTLYKGKIPTHQYMPLPNYAVQMATSYGKTLTQTFERSDWASDI